MEFLKKSLHERTELETLTLCQWLIQNFKIFNKIPTEIVEDILNNSKLLECDENLLLIKQNEMGSTFFLILNGKVSVYINTELVMDQEEERVVSASSSKASPKKERIDNYPKVTDRNKFGNFIGFIETGHGFGEMALISDDVRNATIITDVKSQFLVLNKTVYNRSLRKYQEAEYQVFSDFVNCSPVFYNWAPRYKKQVAMSLRRSTFPFEVEIIKQGDRINGIGFIVEGQAKVIMDITQHSQQYPDLNIRDHLLQSKNESTIKGGLLIQSLEKVKKLKHLELSLVGPGEIIGDVEQAFGLGTSYKTLVPTETTEVYFLSERNYERLLNSKKNQSTADMLRKWAEAKLLSQFRRTTYQQIPLIENLVNSIKYSREKLENQQQIESRPKQKSILKQTDFITRGPIIDMYGPGTVFYRNRQLRQKNKGKQTKSNDPKFKKKINNNASDNKTNITGTQLDRDPTFLDWETSGNKLDTLESNIESWLNSDLEAGKLNVPKFRRFIKKENEPLKPGKTILLKPKKMHQVADIVTPANSNYNNNIIPNFDMAVNTSSI